MPPRAFQAAAILGRLVRWRSETYPPFMSRDPHSNQPPKQAILPHTVMDRDRHRLRRIAVGIGLRVPCEKAS
jgi:hypothetical protein